MSNHTIIISDLHIDDWTDRKIRGKSRKDHFFKFLDSCDKNEVRELVINGDLMDMPPYKGQYVFQPAPSPNPSDGQAEQPYISRQVIERLLQFGAKSNRTITYVFGNHDIGISGFRCAGPNNVVGLQGANFSYPNYEINIGDTTILVEHGHFYDPFLVLYVKDLAKRTYMPWEFEDFDWTMQRRDPETGVRKPPGIPDKTMKPIKLKVGANAYETVAKAQQRDEAELSLGRVLDWSRKFAEDMGKAIVDVPKKAIWWAAALHKMRDYIREHDHPRKLYQVFGHTHRSFVGEQEKGVGVMQDGVECFYLNSGGWTDDTNEGWYLDVDENGKVWLQDWIKEKKDDKRQR